MELRTILNQQVPHQGFVYGDGAFSEGRKSIVLKVRARANSRPVCSGCGRRGPVHDHLPARAFNFPNIMRLPLVVVYGPRRVRCKGCGVKVERIPWAIGKSPMSTHLAVLLAEWAMLLPWQTVARTLNHSWDTVAAAVGWVVGYGMERQSLDDIAAIGVDELYTGKRGKFLTLVYEIDKGMRRLLWVARGRSAAVLNQFFDEFGAARCQSLHFICTDMCESFLKAARERCGQALVILDKFHLISNVRDAVEETRRDEVERLHREGRDPSLKRTRWIFLKLRRNLTFLQRSRLRDLIRMNLRTTKAYLLAEDFGRLWEYVSIRHAERFLHHWCADVMRHRTLPHMKRCARSLLSHCDLIINYFRARKELTSAAVEAMNGQARACITASRGYRYDETMKIALFHRLGHLPWPQLGYRFSG